MSHLTLKDLPPPPEGKTGWPWTIEATQVPETRPDSSAWPKISIVTPAYNQGRFVEETIRSVLLQGYFNLEYIVILALGRDEGLEIIRKYEPLIRFIIICENEGYPKIVNKGFKICSGDVITWISSDDIYLKDAFYNIVRYWDEARGCGVMSGGFQFMGEDSNIEKNTHLPHLPKQGSLDLTLVPLDKWRLHQVSTFYTRWALDDVGRFVREDIKSNIDRELLYRVCLRHKPFLIYKPLAAFRRHPESLSCSVSNIIPMAREYASIQHLFFTGNNKDNKCRKSIARHIIAKGYVKYAKNCHSVLNSIKALIISLVYRPSFLVHKGYFMAWLKVLGILSLLSWAKNLLTGTRNK